MKKPRSLETFLFKISCKSWRFIEEKKCKVVEIRNDNNGYDTLDIGELDDVIEYLIKCREWMRESE